MDGQMDNRTIYWCTTKGARLIPQRLPSDSMLMRKRRYPANQHADTF